jgi:hypothetical protein
MNEAETRAEIIDQKIKVYGFGVLEGASIFRWYNIPDVNDKVKKGLIDAVSDTVNDALSDAVNTILNLKEGADIKDIMEETRKKEFKKNGCKGCINN